MNRTWGPHRLLQDRSSTLNNKFPMARIHKKKRYAKIAYQWQYFVRYCSCLRGVINNVVFVSS